MIPRWPRPAQSACRTRSRARSSGASACCGPGPSRTRSCEHACAPAARRSWARRSLPPRSASPPRCRRRAAPRSCAARCVPRCSATTLATSRRWRIRARSRPYARPARGGRAEPLVLVRPGRRRVGRRERLLGRLVHSVLLRWIGLMGREQLSPSAGRAASRSSRFGCSATVSVARGRRTVVGQAAETRVCRPGP